MGWRGAGSCWLAPGLPAPGSRLYLNPASLRTLGGNTGLFPKYFSAALCLVAQR